MAGDWLKWTKGLAKKPEVLQIASRLKLGRHAVAGMLMEVWEWADDNVVLEMSGSEPDTVRTVVRFGAGRSPDSTGTAVRYAGSTDELLAALTGAVGLAEAMREVGWLVDADGLLEFPNFDRHNGKPAKSRALDAVRKKAQRSPPPSRPEGVRPPSEKCPDANRTQTGPEKRREEKREEDPPTPQWGGGVIPVLPFKELLAEWAAARLPGHDAKGGIEATANRKTWWQQRQADPQWAERWREAVRRLGKSFKARGMDPGFPRGVRIDDFLKNPDLVSRVFEGEYDNPPPGQTTANRGKPPVVHQQDEF